MATKNSSKTMSGKLLNATEKQAISKLMRIHEPMLKEMEKWKTEREKLETTLLDHIDTIGKILEPYYDQTKRQIGALTGQSRTSARYPNKKAAPKKKSRAKKSRSR